MIQPIQYKFLIKRVLRQHKLLTRYCRFKKMIHSILETQDWLEQKQVFSTHAWVKLNCYDCKVHDDLKKKIPAKSGRLHESSSDVRACMCPYLAALINGVSPNLSCLLQSAPKDIKRLIVSTSFDVAARWMPVCKYIDSTKDWKHLSRRLSSTHYPHPATPFLQRAGW